MTRPTQRGPAAAPPAAHPGSAGGSDEAEPLAASWDPAADPEREPPGDRPVTGRRRRPRRLARLLRIYGWRVYAVPVLAALTALAIVDTVGSSASQAAQPAPTRQAPSEPPATPLIPNPAGGPDLAAAKASAELPGGGSFSKRGAGTWSVVSGAGPRFGDGRLFRYTVELEDGVQLPGGPEGFATTVDATLHNPKSWVGSDEYAFQRVDDPAAAEIRITLTSQQTTRRICGFSIPFDASCWRGGHEQVVLNTARWARGAVAFEGNVVQYQQYVINHEVGHALGFSHVGCQSTGSLAPVMMQQTWGVSNDYIAALGSDGVDADGKVCEANAWPFPRVN